MKTGLILGISVLVAACGGQTGRQAAAGQDGLAHLFILPPQSTLTIHVGKRKIKLRPEELQKVTGERGRRGSLMRGLQKIDRVEIDSPRRAAAGDSEE